MTVSGPRILLHLEGLALLSASVAAYWAMEGNWWVFAAAFLAPDLAFVAYLGGTRIGAAAYNATHTTALPLLLIVAAIVAATRLPAAAALIWLAHIGFDRALGYGLKYPTRFKDTHLSRL